MKNKKRIIAIAAVAAALAAIIAVICICINNKNKLSSLEQAGISQEDITLISHRGFAQLAPENTLEAAGESAKNGYTSIEFDIRRTLDGVWILMHDSDIKRTTDGEGEVNQLTYKQIISCKIDKGSNVDEYELITVPSLRDMLILCSELNLRPVIEIKESGTEHLLELLHEIARYRSGDFDIISFSREQTEAIQSILKLGQTALSSSAINIYWLVSEFSEETADFAESESGIGISFSCNAKKIDENVKALQKSGVSLGVWTVNSPKQLKELYDLGIRTFTTDRIVP